MRLFNDLLDLIRIYYFLLTPIIPPKIPNMTLTAIIIIDCTFNENFQFKILDIKYINIIYIPSNYSSIY